MIVEVLLGPGHPDHPPLLQVRQMAEVDVSLVKYDDFTLLDPGAQLPGPLGVRVPRRVDDRKTGQKTLQVQPQMTLGGGLPSPMLGPVHTRGDQLDGGRVHHVDLPLELPHKALAGFPLTKRGDRSPKCSNTAQNSCSAIAASRTLLAWERLLRLGGVAPRSAESGPELS